MKTQLSKQGYFFTYKKKGLGGVLDLLQKNSQRSTLARTLLNFDRKYFVAFKFLRHLSQIESGALKYGPAVQVSKLLRKLDIKLEIFNSYQNSRIDTQKGLLIYGVNHDAFLEGFLLYTILRQKNIKLVAYRFYHFLGGFIRKNSFPVVARVSNHKEGNSLSRFFSLGKRFSAFEHMKDNERRAMNQRSLAASAQTLEEGGVVVIFPGGGGDESKKWRGGLSRIMMNVSKEKRQEITLLPVYFSGMGRKRTLFRVYKAYRNIKQSPLRVGVYFGRQKKLSEIYALFGEDLRENRVLDYLRKDAFNQFGLKEFPLKNYLYPKHYPRAVSYGLRFATKILLQIIPFSHLIRS